MNDQLAALQSSVTRLRGIIEPLTAEQLRMSAYPSEWNVADVLSHMGSSAIINGAWLRAALDGTDQPDPQPVWDEWNAKSPEAKAADALLADQAYVDRIDALSDADRARFRFSIGPLNVDLAGFVQLRVNEHALHTWDVDVTFDPAATVSAEVTPWVVDNLGMIAQFAGKPTGREGVLHIRATEPARDFTLALAADSVSLTAADDAHAPDLELPAEALIRLVYGRLDAQHTPLAGGDADLDELRRVFAGV